jgi:exodeoxyribonuclease V beta subunit
VDRIIAEHAGSPDRFLNAYQALDFGGTEAFKAVTRKRAESMLRGLVDVLALCGGEGAAGRACIDAVVGWRGDALSYSRCTKDTGWTGFRVYVPPRYRQSDGTSSCGDACPGLAELIEFLDRTFDPFVSHVAAVSAHPELWVLRESVGRLRAAASAHKRLHGLITFDDMVTRVRDAVTPERNPRADILQEALRANFRYALVDEFQDTDPVQWDIFRTLFLDGDGDHRLFLVGDPKQAIYGFRGADVFTYLAAADRVSRMGCRYRLDQNFRSTPELIAALNGVFGSGGWFTGEVPGGVAGAGDPVRGISYAPVEPPERNPRVRLHADSSARAALTAVHLEGEGELNTAQALMRYAEFVGNEIARLLASPSKLVFQDAGSPEGAVRPLNAGDICVLVQKRRTSRAIERCLRAHGVPFTFYKKQGLYQSDEAAHLSYLLAALAEPERDDALRKALLTRFFEVSLDELEEHPLRADRELADMLERWELLGVRRQWSRLFATIVADTGLELREAREVDGERRITNFRHLFDDLQLAAVEQSLDLVGLTECLEQRRAQSVDLSDESDLHRLESEAPKVQIMTMHTSKGLQFPVVFIADGFSAPPGRGSGVIRYHNADGTRVFELTTGAEQGAEAAREEAHEEIKRLYYVAMTRAQFKLYVPYGWTPGRTPSFSPVTDLLTPCLDPFWSREAPGRAVQNDARVCHVSLSGEILGSGKPECPVHPSVEDRTAASAAAHPWGECEDTVPVTPELWACRRHVDSFTSLARHVHGQRPGELSVPFEMDDATAEDADMDQGIPALGEAGTEDEADPFGLLPRGTQTGDIAHRVLEVLCGGEDPGFGTLAPYANAESESLLDAEPRLARVIDDAMLRYGLADRRVEDASSGRVQSVRGQLAGLVQRALCVPVLPGGLRLCRIGPAQRQAEVSFFLSEGESVLGADAGIAADRRGLFTGFVDLMFEHAGRYYIADWKTNTLEDYGPEALRAAMEGSDYELQYRLYVLAILEWLKRSVPDFTLPRFGGVLYLFVRGMRVDGEGEGVFHAPWSPALLDEYRRFVRERLRGLPAGAAPAAGEVHHA